MPERPDFSLEGFMHGDRAMIKKVYQWCYPSMIRRSMRYTGDIEVSKDLLHNIFAEIIEKGMRKDVRIESTKKLAAYLLTWIQNDSLNHVIRTTGQERYHRALHYVMLENKMDIAPQVEQEMFKRELWNVLESIINTLPKQCRRVYRMVRLEGLDRQEVADQLNITLSSVNNHVSKAQRLISERAKKY